MNRKERRVQQANTRQQPVIEFRGTSVTLDAVWQAVAQEYNRGNLPLVAELCDAIIAKMPANADAHNNRGVALIGLGQFEAAAVSCSKALTLKPDYADAYYNAGLALQSLERFEEALARYNTAIRLQPGNAKAFNNRANVLQQLHRYDAVLADYDKAIAINPTYADAYVNKSWFHLLRGEYEEGWKLFEWRWKGSIEDAKRDFQKPLWLGKEPLAGKTILLYSEQGLGDAIQFARYVPMVEALGAHVILEVQAPLITLMKSLAGTPQLIEYGSAWPEFDFHCPLMSLPHAFGTRLDTVPATTPYLSATPAAIQYWRTKLGAKSRPRIGLVWSGRAEHKNDRNRSMTLSDFAPLFNADVELHCLQKELRTADATMIEQGAPVIFHGEALQDFDRTAGLIEAMELVISVDTSVAHLAGALAKPLWVLLPFVPDYRWLLERENSPWYPTARLIRQSEPGNWASVAERLAPMLAKL